MSEYFIQQSLGNATRTVIKDEDGKSLFLMIGRWGCRGDVLTLYSMDGTLVARIKQTSLSLGTRFELYQGFDKVGTLQKLLNWNLDFYYIHHLNWAVVGDIRNHHYSIYQVNHRIMTMDAAFMLTGDYYVLDIPNDADAPLCICISAILDYWLYNRKKSPKKGSTRFNISWT